MKSKSKLSILICIIGLTCVVLIAAAGQGFVSGNETTKDKTADNYQSQPPGNSFYKTSDGAASPAISANTEPLEQANKHWEPGDGHKMHYPQLPDEEGWNVYASDDFILADDWQCAETGPVSDIHFWGSWLNGDTGIINSFEITIYDNLPASDTDNPQPYNIPGNIVWMREIPFSEVAVNHIIPDPQLWEGWYDPASGEYLENNHDNYYQYNVTEIEDPFIQTKDSIYWLGIKANVLEGQPQPQWGWKTSLENWNGNMLWGGVRCDEPDDGTGTVELPANCAFISEPDRPLIILFDVLDATSIEINATIDNFTCNNPGLCTMPLPPDDCEEPGGTLGGDGHCFEATMHMDVIGTGYFNGFTRNIDMTVYGEIHTGPRTPGTPEQIIPAGIIRLEGELLGDPDFCTFQFRTGEFYGLPGTGQIIIKELPDGNFMVESFFDITYQIEYQGCPGSVISDYYSGITTESTQITQGVIEWNELKEPVESNLILSTFYVNKDPWGNWHGGGGEDAYGNGWYHYPQDDWWSIWFYDHPYSAERYKEIKVKYYVSPFDDIAPTYMELAIGWSTDLWSLEQPPEDSLPPLPGVDEELYINRAILYADEITQGYYNFHYTIPDYNPEWVSIDIGGYNYSIAGGKLYHEYLDVIPADPLDLAFVITGNEPSNCEEPGECNGLPPINILDITYLISFLYKGGPAPVPFDPSSGDPNCSCTVNILDITYLISFLYKDGPPPCDCETWTANCGLLHR